ncbi:MAG: tripartite tricarboxylate transporter substrate binding protein [Betaproteobacteria bacterium]|nr:tripartite tricarboxylate transporter substrate binding protein [Betaproteobacteria bacterium]
MANERFFARAPTGDLYASHCHPPAQSVRRCPVGVFRFGPRSAGPGTELANPAGTHHRAFPARWCVGSAGTHRGAKARRATRAKLRGGEQGAKSTPDGYTLLLAPAPFAITQFVYAKLPYDGRKDLVPIGLVQTTPTVVVANPALGARTPQEFMELARKQPGKITYGTPGEGTLPHLIGEMLNLQAGIKLLHVPYKGGGPAQNDLLAGHIDSSILTPMVRDLVKAGKVVVIGTTSLTPTPSTADWPTFAQSGLPGFEALAWFGLMAPAGTPPEIVAKLSQNLQLALKNPETRAQIAQSGDVPEGTQAEFSALLQREYQRWERTVKAAGIKQD